MRVIGDRGGVPKHGGTSQAKLWVKWFSMGLRVLNRTIAEYRGEFKENQVAIVLHAYSNRLAFAPLTPETFVYGFSDEYRLNIADAGGRTVLAMTVNEKPQSISGKEKEETKKSGVSAWLGTNDKTLRDNDFPDHQPFFVRLFTDKDTARHHKANDGQIRFAAADTSDFFILKTSIRSSGIHWMV
jgi:hypothetical protein